MDDIEVVLERHEQRIKTLERDISDLKAVQNMKKIATIHAGKDLLQSFLNFLLKYSNPPKIRWVCP